MCRFQVSLKELRRKWTCGRFARLTCLMSPASTDTCESTPSSGRPPKNQTACPWGTSASEEHPPQTPPPLLPGPPPRRMLCVRNTSRSWNVTTWWKASTMPSWRTCATRASTNGHFALGVTASGNRDSIQNLPHPRQGLQNVSGTGQKWP